MVVSCASTADVAAAVLFADDRGLEVSVRGAAQLAGHAVCEGGPMIDLTAMKSIVVDARTSGGVRRRHDVRERDAATQEHALAVPAGFVSTTGVAGLTLGGGFGWLTRLAGLSSDNLIAAEVVTADGDILRASRYENGDRVLGPHLHAPTRNRLLMSPPIPVWSLVSGR
jgi:FAD/FMN-containing dehydrogenase